MIRGFRSLLLLPALLLAACAEASGPEGDAVVQLGEEFTLRPGQAAVVAGPELRVRFLAVVDDQRCGAEAYCVWEGFARIAVDVAAPGAPPQVVEIDTHRAPRFTYQGLDVSYQALDPDRSLTRPSTRYRLTLRVDPESAP